MDKYLQFPEKWKSSAADEQEITIKHKQTQHKNKTKI
jgi:hypothetical protein